MAPQTPAEGFKIGLSACLSFSTDIWKKDFALVTVNVCVLNLGMDTYYVLYNGRIVVDIYNRKYLL